VCGRRKLRLRDVGKPGWLKSIAVRPFVFLNELPESRALSLGFADALITVLGSLEDIRVLPTSAFLNYAAGADPAHTCGDLGVDQVLQANIQKLGARWRVSLQHFDVPTQGTALSEKHDFKLENVFDMQDEIGRRVVASLQSRFSSAVGKSRDRCSSDPKLITNSLRVRVSTPPSGDSLPTSSANTRPSRSGGCHKP
jgi:TolB-like protein